MVKSEGEVRARLEELKQIKHELDFSSALTASDLIYSVRGELRALQWVLGGGGGEG